MSRYPILVDRFDDKKAPADLAVCEQCDHEQRYDPAEGPPEDVLTCDACGAFRMTHKYDEAIRCAGCDRLGFWDYDGLHGPGPGDYCCSRVCLLQAEYAATLREPTT